MNSSDRLTPKNNDKCSFEVKKVRYRNILQTAASIYQTEGLRAFGKGIYPRMTINVPATALSWGTYEFVKGILTKKNSE